MRPVQPAALKKNVVHPLTGICAHGYILVMLETFVALAEPNRLRIVELLRTGPRPVGEIGGRLHLQQPKVSKHLRVLKDAGLVSAQVRAQQRVYGLRPEPLRENQRVA